MQDIISVIMPVYNSAPYIEKAVQSVLNQSYKEFELIIVDDGSNDNSYQILNSLAKQDLRIHLFHQENKGVSEARNNALDHATGKYIAFIDSDDYLPQNALKIRAEAIKDYDLLITSFQNVDENGDDIEQETGREPVTNVVCPASEVIDNLFFQKKFGYQGYLWTKLFRRRLIEQSNIRFDPNLAYNEDRLFILIYLQKCSKVRIIQEKTYYYVRRKTSKMGLINKTFTKNMLSDFKAFEIMKGLLPDGSVAKDQLCIDEFFYANKWIEMKNTKPEYKQYLIKLQRDSIKLLYIIIISLIVILCINNADKIYAYLLRGQSQTDLRSASGRLIIWSYAFQYISKRPIFGYGFGAGGEMVGKILPGGFNGFQHMHNGIVETLLGTGIIGLVFLSIQFIIFISNLIRAIAKEGLRKNLFDFTLLLYFIIRTMDSLGIGNWQSIELIIWFYVVIVSGTGMTIQTLYLGNK